MNFLAHVYLSGDDKLLTVGNFIGDFVKGNKYDAFPGKIRKGIIIHRLIDSYTDNHPLTAEARQGMRSHFGKYAGIYLDIFYDHFLAANWHNYHSMNLRWYAYRFYWWLLQNYRYLPQGIKSFLPNLIAINRLYTYHSIGGIQRALSIMSLHSSLPDYTDEAILYLANNYTVLQTNFQHFFPDLQQYIKWKIDNLD